MVRQASPYDTGCPNSFCHICRLIASEKILAGCRSTATMDPAAIENLLRTFDFHIPLGSWPDRVMKNQLLATVGKDHVERPLYEVFNYAIGRVIDTVETALSLPSYSFYSAVNSEYLTLMGFHQFACGKAVCSIPNMSLEKNKEFYWIFCQPLFGTAPMKYFK